MPAIYSAAYRGGTLGCLRINSRCDGSGHLYPSDVTEQARAPRVSALPVVPPALPAVPPDCPAELLEKRGADILAKCDRRLVEETPPARSVPGVA